MSPKKRLIPIAVLLLAAAGAGAWYLRGRSRAEAAPFAASGTVEATEAQLGFQASGQVAEITVHEGDRVRAGQVLARLDPAEAQARRSQAEAQVAAGRAALAELERGSRPEESGPRRCGRAGTGLALRGDRPVPRRRRGRQGQAERRRERLPARQGALRGRRD